ncbi:MAG TPA: hypothetical protein VE641_18305 [Chthoniobacterales bacterium]|nr:hypothetical protein [Chthoniobacterales bacterium]
MKQVRPAVHRGTSHRVSSYFRSALPADFQSNLAAYPGCQVEVELLSGLYLPLKAVTSLASEINYPVPILVLAAILWRNLYNGHGAST